MLLERKSGRLLTEVDTRQDRDVNSDVYGDVPDSYEASWERISTAVTSLAMFAVAELCGEIERRRAR